MVTEQKKDFDCIQIKRDAQTEIYEAIKQMSPEEEIVYFRRSIEESKFSSWWKSVSSRIELAATR